MRVVTGNSSTESAPATGSSKSISNPCCAAIVDRFGARESSASIFVSVVKGCVAAAALGGMRE
jgi:hypothetical protein